MMLTKIVVIILLLGLMDCVTISKPRDKMKSIEEMHELYPSFQYNDKIELRQTKWMGNGLFAKSEIFENENIFIIPIETQTLNSKIMYEYFPIFKKSKQRKFYLLSYFVASLYLSDNQHIALDNLPPNLTCAVDHLQVIEKFFPKGSYEYAISDLQDVHEIYLKIDKWVDQDSKISYNDFLWGVCIVLSRTYSPSDEELRREYGNLLIIPGAELVNHQIEENCVYKNEVIDNQHYWIYYANSDIPEGEQLFNSYYGYTECKTKLESFFIYDFVLDEKGCNQVYIKNNPLIIEENLVTLEGVEPNELEYVISKEIQKYEIDLDGLNKSLAQIHEINKQYLEKALQIIQNNHEAKIKKEEKEKRKKKMV